MKIFKLFVLVFIVGLSSCGIDDMQSKPDYTKPGKQMFDQTDQNVKLLTGWLDLLLKMNTYIQAPEANRITVEDTYFTKYKIRNSALNTWSLIEQGDTVCRIIVDGKPFTETGAKWEIQAKNMLSPCPFVCINSSKWMLTVSNFAVYKPTSVYSSDAYYNSYSSTGIVTTFITDSLCFESETLSPESFEKSNFQISGKGEYLQTNNNQKVQISFFIEQNLKHVANSYFTVNSGKLSLTALDLKNLQSGEASAEFETLIGDNRKLTIVYNGRTQIYPNNNQSTNNQSNIVFPE